MICNIIFGNQASVQYSLYNTFKTWLSITTWEHKYTTKLNCLFLSVCLIFLFPTLCFSQPSIHEWNESKICCCVWLKMHSSLLHNINISYYGKQYLTSFVLWNARLLNNNYLLNSFLQVQLLKLDNIRCINVSYFVCHFSKLLKSYYILIKESVDWSYMSASPQIASDFWPDATWWCCNGHKVKLNTVGVLFWKLTRFSVVSVSDFLYDLVGSVQIDTASCQK